MNGECLKLTTYGGERARSGDRYLADAVLDVYERHGIEVSLLLRGALGFGAKHQLRTDRLLTLSEDLPLVSVAVDARERIEAALEEIVTLKRSGLVTLERARMITDFVPVETPTKLTIYVGRQERVYGMPAYAALMDLLYRRGVAGATALLGVDGTAHGKRRRAAFFGRNAEVPMMVIAVGDGQTIGRVLPELGGLLRHPLATVERVRVCKRDGVRLEEPHSDTGKLMVYASEQAHHDGRPMHLELVRRLRRAGVSGATTLRGVWGFHGDHAPHGDKLFQLRRHVPTVTTVVDRPDRIMDAFAVIDELTAERGLVTSEIVRPVR